MLYEPLPLCNISYGEAKSTAYKRPVVVPLTKPVRSPVRKSHYIHSPLPKAKETADKPVSSCIANDHTRAFRTIDRSDDSKNQKKITQEQLLENYHNCYHALRDFFIRANDLLSSGNRGRNGSMDAIDRAHVLDELFSWGRRVGDFPKDWCWLGLRYVQSPDCCPSIGYNGISNLYRRCYQPDIDREEIARRKMDPLEFYNDLSELGTRLDQCTRDLKEERRSKELVESFKVRVQEIITLLEALEQKQFALIDWLGPRYRPTKEEVGERGSLIGHYRRIRRFSESSVH